MIPVTAFAGKKVAVFGLGGSGLVSASALLAGGADVVAFDDNVQSVAKANAAGIPTADLRQADWSKIRGPGAGARRAAHSSGAALDRPARAQGRRRGDRRYRIVLPRAGEACAGRALRRHHRHQRQIDHHGADRAPRHIGRPGRAARRQYRHRDPVAAAASSRSCPRHRMLVLSDRSRALARSLGRHFDQSQRRPSRSSRHHGTLRRREGTPRRRRAEQRHGDRRRR